MFILIKNFLSFTLRLYKNIHAIFNFYYESSRRWLKNNYKTNFKLMKIKTIIILLSVIIISPISYCKVGPEYAGRYEICGYGTLAFYLNVDGTCSNGKGNTNGGIQGKWQRTSSGINISEMSSIWDGDYKLDGTTEGVALKKGNLRYCNPSYR
jgi:hypothetical protein